MQDYTLSEAFAYEKAHVHCVIVGVHVGGKKLTQSPRSPQSPRSCGLLSLRGDSEFGSSGEGSEKSPHLQISKTPSSDSNINPSRTSRTSRETKTIYDSDGTPIAAEIRLLAIFTTRSQCRLMRLRAVCRIPPSASRSVSCPAHLAPARYLSSYAVPLFSRALRARPFNSQTS